MPFSMEAFAIVSGGLVAAIYIGTVIAVLMNAFRRGKTSPSRY